MKHSLDGQPSGQSLGSPPALPPQGDFLDSEELPEQTKRRWSESHNSRKSLDPNVRPPSHRGTQGEKPWIGTFGFEGDGAKETSPMPINPAASTSASEEDKESSQKHPADDPSVQPSPDSNSSDLEKQQSQSHSLRKHPSTRPEPEQSEKDPNLIDWEGPDDPGNPQNFPRWKKWIYSCIMGSMTFVLTFASSIWSTTVNVTAEEFNTSSEVMILGVALFVIGFGVGPIVFGPFSELFGRKVPMFIGYFIFVIFQIPVAVAQNLETILVCRFLGGVFGSSALAIVGGYLADLWNPVDRAYAMCIFSGATFIGPVTAPIVGSFVTESYLGWRWTSWLTCIAGFAAAILGFVVLPETFAPVLLQQRAKKMRHETKNWAIHAKLEETRVTFHDIITRYVFRSFHMMLLEPILVLITLYISFIYGLIYLFFESYPVAFQESRGYSPGIASLPFIAIGVGVLCGCAIIVTNTMYRVKPIYERDGKIEPEERLVPMIIGAPLLPIGLFWFAWTSSPSISPWPQIVAGIPIGCGIQMIFLQGLNYIIDVYKMNANSALAANTLVRSAIGGSFPIFATGMYHNLGVDWATSTLGFLAVALAPVPVLFWIYGARIRARSKYSPAL